MRLNLAWVWHAPKTTDRTFGSQTRTGRRGGVFDFLCDVRLRGRDLLRIEDLALAHGPVGGLVEDFHIRQFACDERI